MILGSQLKNAIISGSNNILKAKRFVNELNIFPVPDGDTGTNMSLTIGAASDLLAELSDDATAEEVSKTAASAMLRGARGNSGVILSLLFRGFSKGLAGHEEIDAGLLVESLEIGVAEAYKAVMKPTEGTMLTVARVAAESGRAALENDDDPIHIWDAVCAGAYTALENTPNLLPILKKAGVVDAGGQGVCLIFDGMMSVFKSGIIIETGLTPEEKAAETEEFFKNVAAEFDGEITFTYCTEYIIGRDETIPTEPLELRLFLETIGDCVVVADDDEIIKVHVHTENPGHAIQKALEFGQLLTVKIDNMREQHRQNAEANEKAKAERGEAELEASLQPKEPTEEFGVVSVCAGDGVRELFVDLGCDQIVSGGQTMNPSTEDILAAILATPAKNVFVLPNNKNIILAAEQAVPLTSDRNVIVLPTKTIPQGLSAMLAFDADVSADDNLFAMSEAANAVDTGLVTFAARDSEFAGHSINNGDILGMINGKLEFIGEDAFKTAVKVARSLIKKDTEFITLIYGNGVTEEQAEAVKQKIISKTHTDAEISVVNGDQPLYYFIISAE